MLEKVVPVRTGVTQLLTGVTGAGKGGTGAVGCGIPYGQLSLLAYQLLKAVLCIYVLPCDVGYNNFSVCPSINFAVN